MWPFLTNEQQEAVDAFSKYCKKEILPTIKSHANTPLLPKDVVLKHLKQLVEFGMGNGRVPVEDGGLGLSPVTGGLLLEAGNQYGRDVVRWAFINETVARLLARYGDASMKKKYLEPLLAGELIGSSASSEPSGGSDLQTMKTRAVRTKNGFAISGRKVWISNGAHADFVIVLARTEETGKIDLYLVDKKEHGFDATPLITMGSATTAELAFNDVEIPEANRLNTEGKGIGATMALLQDMRAYAALTCTGLAMAAQEAAIEYSKDRTLFGGTLASKQLIQAQLADNHVEIEAARLLAYRALELSARGMPCAVEASMAKLYASEMAQRVTDRALQIHGAYGTTPEYPVEKLYRMARLGTFYDGTSEIQRLIIGKALTGVAAF